MRVQVPAAARQKRIDSDIRTGDRADGRGMAPDLEAKLEAICAKGCRLVWGDIALLERGGELPETADLGPEDRALLLRELKSVMAVYGERCVVD